MVYPNINEVKKMSKNHNIIPVMSEIYADTETPISIFQRFAENKFCFLLESIEGGEKSARYSFIGRDPFIVAKSKNNITIIEDRDGKIQTEEGNPIEVIKKLMDKYKGADIPNIPRFNGGAVGFFGYDLVRYYENLPDLLIDDLNLPECHFMFYDEVIVFDHLKQKIQIVVNIHVNGDIEESYRKTEDRLKEIMDEIKLSSWKVNGKFEQNGNKNNSNGEYLSNVSKEEFCESVVKAKEYIKNGDIFQVVLSQRLKTKIYQKPIDVYRVLRVINPSPYMYYLKFDDYSIVGASPEMLVRVEDGIVETCPIAGTRKRGKTDEEDEMLENELKNDKKEVAEHTMLADLGRNDIGKVSKFGSVKVLNLKHIEKYSHVMHMVTNVKGELKENMTSFDALMAVFPAGTLSGAPKVRAMEIIDEIETVKRGIYGGAIGYLSFNGNLDSCITIRTIVFKEQNAYVQVGAGIVSDSEPMSEYNETINKANALLKALKEVENIQ